jgi:hypothetical protein
MVLSIDRTDCVNHVSRWKISPGGYRSFSRWQTIHESSASQLTTRCQDLRTTSSVNRPVYSTTAEE